MQCQYENIFSDALSIDYTFMDRVRMSIKRIPILGAVALYLKNYTNGSKEYPIPNSHITKASPTNGEKIIKIDKSQTKLNLQPGQIIRVRSKQEINQTLNEKNQFEHVDFMKGMYQYCGQNFKVFKRVEKIFDPYINRYRKCSDLVILEGLFCHGSEYSPECDRTCLYYWKEAWLKKID